MTSRDERREKQHERVYRPNLGLFLTIQLPILLVVDTDAYVALLRTITRPLSEPFSSLVSIIHLGIIFQVSQNALSSQPRPQRR